MKNYVYLLLAFTSMVGLLQAKFQDHYATLGIPKTATSQEIKKAYHALARKYHPDKNSQKDATEKFQALNEAFSTLSDPARRAAFDRTFVAKGAPSCSKTSYDSASSKSKDTPPSNQNKESSCSEKDVVRKQILDSLLIVCISLIVKRYLVELEKTYPLEAKIYLWLFNNSYRYTQD